MGRPKGIKNKPKRGNQASRQPVRQEPRARKPKQLQISDPVDGKPIAETDHPEADKIRAMAEDYAETRDGRMALGREEVTKRDALKAKLQECGLTDFRSGDIHAFLVEGKPKVKVKRDGADEDDPTGDPE